MKLNVNKKFMVALLATTMSFSLVGCSKAGEKNTVYSTPSGIEFLDESDKALHNIQDDYEDVLEITELYFEARDNNDSKKIKKFFKEMRNLYFNYDDSKSRKAEALLPYLIEAEIVFKDTKYSFTDEEIAYLDEMVQYIQTINGYTIPEFDELYNGMMEEDEEIEEHHDDNVATSFKRL